MAHNVKCPYCKMTFDADKEPFVKIGRRYAHVYCSEHIEETMPTEDYNLMQLKDYINRKYGKAARWPMIMTQIAEYKARKITYEEMLNALKYFYDIKGGSVKQGNGGIGIIEYVYNDAKKYFAEQKAKKENIANLNNYIQEVQDITIYIPKPKRKIKLFNLEED